MNWITRSIARRLYYSQSRPSAADDIGALICAVIFMGIVVALAFNWI